MEQHSAFIEFFMFMGPFKIPMIILFLIVVGLIIKKIFDLFILKDCTPGQKKWGLNAILFWGSFSLAFGLFGQLNGLWLALREIIQAADISPSIVIIGFLMSFITTMFGALTLLIAALAWWAFRYRLKSMP